VEATLGKVVANVTEKNKAMKGTRGMGAGGNFIEGGHGRPHQGGSI
jgi:hypothetical protein